MSDDTDSAERQQDVAMLDRAASSLYEHFDTVQIFATRHQPGDDGGTVRFQWGKGNFFARYGQVRHWLLLEDESTRLVARDGESPR